MKDSIEKGKKQVEDVFLTIFYSILQAFIFIFRILGFNHNGRPYRPTPSSPEDCYDAGSDPPSTSVDPSDDEYEEEREYDRPHKPPPPPWSTGGGGQTD